MQAVTVGRWAPRPWATLVLALAGVLVLSVAVAASWRALRTSSDAGHTGRPWAGSVGLTEFSPAKRGPAPAVVASTLDGERLALAELRGHVVVLNVWGSWCAPCRAEAGDLAAVSKETHGSGVRFIGIDVRDFPSDARAFQRRYGINYPSWDDPDAKLLARFSGIVPISAVPSTIVVDQSGAVAARIIGRVRAADLRAVIADLIAAGHPHATSGIAG